MRQQSGKYLAANRMVSSIGMDFALNFGGKTKQKKQKRSSLQNFWLPDHVYSICLATNSLAQRCRSLLSIGGDNLQFYPNFALFSTLGRMNLDHDFVQVWKFSEDQQ